MIGEGSHPEKVKVYGPGVEKTGLKANEPTYFTVDCSEAGQGGFMFLIPSRFTSLVAPEVDLNVVALRRRQHRDQVRSGRGRPRGG